MVNVLGFSKYGGMWAEKVLFSTRPSTPLTHDVAAPTPTLIVDGVVYRRWLDSAKISTPQ